MNVQNKRDSPLKFWNYLPYSITGLSFPGDTSVKEPTCQCRRHRRRGFNPWVGKIPCRRAWQPTLVFLPGKSHGHRKLAGYNPQWKWSCSVMSDSFRPHRPHRGALPGSSVHGIFQAIVLEWIAISFCSRSSRPRDRTRVSRIVDRRFTIWATREVSHGLSKRYA